MIIQRLKPILTNWIHAQLRICLHSQRNFVLVALASKIGKLVYSCGLLLFLHNTMKRAGLEETFFRIKRQSGF